MSLNRSQVVWKDPVDPYAVSSSDDDGEKKKKKQEEAKKKKKKKTRPVATTTGRTAGNPPKLKADALETEKEIELGMATGMEGDLAIIKVNSHLEHTRKNVLYSKKDEVIQSMITLKKFVKLPDAPLARYLDLGEQEFQVIPQPPDPSKVFYVARPSASASASDTDVLALSPVTVTYHAHPCLQTAADNLDLTEIETRMRRKQLNLNFALRGVSLTLSEEKKFRENCKGYFGELTRNKFIQAWEAVKGDQPPPEGLVTSMFGTGTGFVLSVDDVVARLSGATLEEADAKALKVRENKEDAEQDLVEEVEGTERVFDDDIEDKPELDPDQSVMDKETKEWDNKKAKDDVGEGGVDGEGEEEEEAKKSHLQELAAGDIELPEPLEDEEDEDEDLTKKLPPPEPAAPNTTTTKNLRKRTASQAEGSKPAKPAAKKAGGKAAKKPKINPLHASIDEQLAKFLTSTPKPLSVLKKEVIFNLPQYAELKQEAFQKQAAGKIANKDQHVRTGITPWGALIVERINKAGGTVDPKGNAFLSK
eukprot:TRINITY_DN11433_c0_g2_i1.p1 TRINITY_DN11433_c0_g2~~TRINITY_DN11433_c0_g2_i1.p1  ORF type:complete len:534 (+),score=170.88 TRINITY_DN11433_c0_g2_i1:14-1615(+)